MGQPRVVRCDRCHQPQKQQLDSSVHGGELRCQDCHGGFDFYELTEAQLAPYVSKTATAATRPPFDHGPDFLGRPSRLEIPERCGTCHADVERMNPYGLRTDQLARYWTSGHGRALRTQHDAAVAVCTDCHGVHEILSPKNPASPVYFQNIPRTCGRCHSDPKRMSSHDLPHQIPEQYARSVHGINVLKKGDSGSPNCATCHGSHGAAPPGFADVRHVCSRCHQQTEQNFRASIHGKIDAFPGCIGCHSGSEKLWDHEIHRAMIKPDRLPELLRTLEPQQRDVLALEQAFARRLDAVGMRPRLDQVCSRCHRPGRTRPHSIFFEPTDKAAVELGRQLARQLRKVQFDYARTVERIDRLGRGVLLVEEQAIRAQDARTGLIGLQAAMHKLDPKDIEQRVAAVEKICDEINRQLDEKEHSLVVRRRVLAAVWIFVALFVLLMYREYRTLRALYVRDPRHPPRGELPVLESRRRFLERVLALCGSAGVLALIYPAIAYVLPARRRGGGTERVRAGRTDDWKLWAVRKVAVRGKPVAVVRTDKGFRAFSLVCTHLGCIVHWNPSAKQFQCPCHAGVFDIDGRVVSGPPPRPLPQYKVVVAQNEVIVQGSQQA